MDPAKYKKNDNSFIFYFYMKTMPGKFKRIAFIFLLTGCSMVQAQSDSAILKHHIEAAQQYAENHPVEKVHLHLDRPWYGLGDTIWFKAYTVAGEFHRPSKLSGVLYAELINGQDSVSKRLIIPLNSGIGKGDFVIPYTYKSGTYRLRAYTNWMRNDSSYFFDRKIIIGGIPSAPDMAANKQVTSTNNNSAQSIAANPDVQFFPEGGYLVNGLRSKIAFKAINKEGLSVAVQGIITDNDNNEVATFNTEHAGMGQFPLTPQKGAKYKAKVSCADGNYFTVDLPGAKNEGFTLTINNAADSLYVKIAASDNLYKSKEDTAFYLIAQSGGKYYFATAGTLENQVYTTKIPAARFPTGIVQFTLFSQSGEPLNERVVFVQNDDQLKLKISAEKESYAAMEKVKLELEAKDEEGKPVAGTFSLAVTDETKAPADEPEETTILTDLLLKAELKGNIENANYYFINENEKTRSDLDLLLLTQYYHRFDWKKILSSTTDDVIYKPEEGLSLEGLVKTTDSLPVAGVKVSLTCLAQNLNADSVTDNEGHFIFNNLQFSDSVKLILQATKKSIKQDIRIYIRQRIYPEVKNTFHLAFLNDTTGQLLIQNNKSGNHGSMLSKIPDKAIALKEVKINGIKSDKPALSNKYGTDNSYTIQGSKLGDFGSVRIALASKLPSVTYSNGSFRKLEFPFPKLHIVLNNFEIKADDIDLYIKVDEVEDVKILQGYAYKALYGINFDPRDHDEDDIILITTKQYAGTNKALLNKLKRVTLKVTDYSGVLNNVPFITTPTPSNIIVLPFAGFSTFMQPAAPLIKIGLQEKLNSYKEQTIYWNPDVITDKDGKASIEFFNASSPGTYRVVVEGIDGYGNLGRQVFRYKVQ